MNNVEETLHKIEENNNYKIITLQENTNKKKDNEIINQFITKSNLLINNFKSKIKNFDQEQLEENIKKLNNDLDESFKLTLKSIEENKKINDVLVCMSRGFKIIGNKLKKMIEGDK